MAALDFILNLSSLLLWLNWRAIKFDPVAQSTPATLAGTLRRAEPSQVRPWHSLVALVLLLFARAWLCWRMEPFAAWTPILRLGVVAPPFRCDRFSLSLWYSVCSFGLMLTVFYLWLLLFSIINGRDPDAGPIQKLLRLHLGWVDRWWWPLKMALPFLAVAGFWIAINPLMASYNIVRPGVPVVRRLEQGATIGLAFYMSWQYLLYGLLLLYVLNSYVFLGRHPFWSLVTVTCRNLLAPLRFLPLRIGKVDFAPFIGIALVFFAAGFAQRKLIVLYSRLTLQ